MDRNEFIPFIRNHEIIKATRSGKLTDNTLFYVRYNSQKNVYESSSPQYCLPGWEKLTYYTEAVDHNHENEHRMSYLMRYTGCPPEVDGIVQWRFDLSAIRNWSRIEIFVGAKLWDRTSIDLRLVKTSCDSCCRRKAKRFQIKTVLKLTSEDNPRKDIKYLDLIAKLKGASRRDVDPPHLRPQLFRTHDRDSEWLFSFTVF